MEENTVGLLGIGGLIATIVVCGLLCGHDGTLIMTGVGSLATIFGIFIDRKIAQRRK